MERLLGLHVLGRIPGVRLASSPFSSKCAMNRSSASSRRLKTRSSASSRSFFGISPYGVMWFGFDHRQVEPGLDGVVEEDRVQDGARAGGDTPNDTLETPSEVFTPGSLLLDSPDPVDRLDRRWPPLLVAGGQR